MRFRDARECVCACCVAMCMLGLDVRGMESPQDNVHVNFHFSGFSIDIDDVLFFEKIPDQNIDAEKLKASVLTSVRLLLKGNGTVDSEGRVEGCTRNLADDISCLVRLARIGSIILNSAECFEIVKYLGMDESITANDCILVNLSAEGEIVIRKHYGIKNSLYSGKAEKELFPYILRDIDIWKNQQEKRIFYIAAAYLNSKNSMPYFSPETNKEIQEVASEVLKKLVD